MERYTISHSQIGEINVLETVQNTAKAAAQHIATHVRQFPSSPITYATGNTMRPFSRELAQTGINFGKTLARHLDEYWCYSPEDEDSFVKFVKTRYVTALGINPNNVAYINGLAANPRVEAARYDEVVTSSRIAKCIIGFGPGGHIGFTESSNDPNLFNLRTHFQELSEETVERDRQRGQDTPSTAITQGPANIGEAENIVGIAYGPEKGRILADALYGPITPKNPASSLRREGVGCHVTLFVDKEAAEEIELAKQKFEREKVS